MRFDFEGTCLELIDEHAAGYTFGSADNPRRYPRELNLSTEPRPNSMVGFVVDGRPRLVVGTFGGLTHVHPRSAVLIGKRLYVALAGFILCVRLPDVELERTLETDPATCFGVYYEPRMNALFSHGELEIARFNLDGSIVWRTSGPDIWTGPFELGPEAIHTTLWDKTPARIDYETGNVTVLNA